ncbi:hypothetical protein [Herbiconiux flava]|uniref:Uncharacterized protein n=1 Tax=Herbiconiux flava TaxID=881268 RepID=A0A852SH48_9MICO|nr:hypothetical protein [Herbiconiux flava]NYD68924.1 hypothetical protein [Herbiconiux flava]GLK15670.1 hypothetical protein GCM10017602_01520 [Herbiconiux flava]
MSQAARQASWPLPLQNALGVGGVSLIIVAVCVAFSAPPLIMASQRDKQLSAEFPSAVVFGFAARPHPKAFFEAQKRLDGLPAEQIRPVYYTAVISNQGIDFWCGWRAYRRIFSKPVHSIESIEMARRSESGRTIDGLLLTFRDGTPSLFAGVHGGAFGGTVVLKRAQLATVYQRAVSVLSADNS